MIAAVSATQVSCPSQRQRQGLRRDARGPEVPWSPGSGNGPADAPAVSVRPAEAAPWPAHARGISPGSRSRLLAPSLGYGSPFSAVLGGE